MTKNKELSIYVHIPFCLKKCFYCDFVSHVAGEEEKEGYVKKLIKEIKNAAVAYKEFEIKTVFLGGGTPSVLSWKQIERIWETLSSNFSMQHSLKEATIEGNPGTLDATKLSAYHKIGFNRLSMGLQSVDEKELRTLGRIHTYEDFLGNYKEARKAGFLNINIDMMSALPRQTVRSYKEGLEKVIALEPEHISAYSLIIEEGTPFYELFGEDIEKEKHLLPTEDDEREMYYQTKNILEKNNYKQYEISNYAKAGFECMHNNVYWQRGNYLGFGDAAASMIENVRFFGKDQEKHKLSKVEQMEEFVFLGMRRMEGISKREFEETFKIAFSSVFEKPLSKMKGQNLVLENKDYIFLSEKGIDVSNYVFLEFLLTE